MSSFRIEDRAAEVGVQGRARERAKAGDQMPYVSVNGVRVRHSAGMDRSLATLAASRSRDPGQSGLPREEHYLFSPPISIQGQRRGSPCRRASRKIGLSNLVSATGLQRAVLIAQLLDVAYVGDIESHEPLLPPNTSARSRRSCGRYRLPGATLRLPKRLYDLRIGKLACPH